MIVLNKDKHEVFGQHLAGKFSAYDSERRQLELQWLKNLRQYKKIYDPEVKIPEGKSRVYPADTHTKIVGWVAKMMEMMFPAQEKNWELGVSPFPNIAVQDLEKIIQDLEQQSLQAAQEAAAAAQEQGQEPPPPQPITSDQIEKAVKAFAEQRAIRMEMEIEDQLADNKTEYPELCKRVVRRGGIYGFGVAEGPLVQTQKEREWQPDPQTGQFVAVEKEVRRPYYEARKSWDIYPDLSAMSWDNQEGLFTRKAFPRHSLVALAKNEDFFGKVIEEYLRDHTEGNYKARNYEAELNEIKQTSTNPPNMKRQFEIIRWYGYVAAQDLKDIGVDVPESALGKDILADVWLLDSIPIKADMAPFGDKVSDMFHVFIPEEDEDGPLTGNAKVEILRDSQMKLCAIDRKTMDDMAKAGSVIEVNDDLLSPNSPKSGQISGGDTIHRQGEQNEANYPAIRAYDIPNNISELLALRKSVLEVFDVESNLPSWLMGNAQPLGEAFRTSNNMSMMSAGGDMVTKDDVRSFDRFVKSLIGSAVRWNMEFNEKDDIKGDYQVLPKGTKSLVAKEVRGAALDQLKTTMTPREVAMTDERKMLIDRFKSRDLPVDYIYDAEKCTQILSQMDAAAAQAAQIEQGVSQTKAALQQAGATLSEAKAEEIKTLAPVKAQETAAKTMGHAAKAKGVKDGTALQSAKLLLDATKPEGPGKGVGRKPQGKAAKK